MLALNQSVIPELSPLHWYNLQTNRKNTKSPNKPIWIVDHYRVGGTCDLIYEFALLNRLNYRDLTSNGILLPEVTITPKRTVITNDIEQLSDEDLNWLNEFRLFGLMTKAKVVSVVDADTLTLAFYLPLSFLTRMRTTGSQKCCYALTNNDHSGFFTQMRARLFGIDEAEIHTDKGKTAKQVLIDKLRTLNHVVYVRFLDFDKYGRVLVMLYEDSNYQRDINTYLKTYHDPIVGAIGTTYYGKTKTPIV